MIIKFCLSLKKRLNPTDALRNKFEKMYGVRPRFHQTLVTFKTGGRVFAPKAVQVICNYD